MGASVDYLHEDRKTGRLSYRRAYPPKLREFIRGSPRELKRSLGASSISTPGALDRFQEATEEYERTVARARKVASGTFDDLDAPRIAWLAQTYNATLLAQDDERRVSGEADPDIHRAADEGLRETLAQGDTSQIRDMFADDAMDLGAAQGWHFDANSSSFATLCWELLKASIVANESRLARDEGDPVPTPPHPFEPPLPKSRVGREEDSGENFRAIAERLLVNPALAISATTRQATMTALRFFAEAHGGLKPHQITRQHAAELRDLLTPRLFNSPAIALRLCAPVERIASSSGASRALNSAAALRRASSPSA